MQTSCLSACEALPLYTMHRTDKRASLRACTHATLGKATAVRTHGKPRHGYCAVPSGLNEGAAVGMRLGALVVGKRVGARVVGMATGATVVGAAVGVAANRTRVPCWHMGRMGGGAMGNEWRGGRADLEVVLRGGSGTWQHRQQLRPPPPPPQSLLHEPHLPLTAASVARTLLRQDHGPSSPTR